MPRVWIGISQRKFQCPGTYLRWVLSKGNQYAPNIYLKRNLIRLNFGVAHDLVVYGQNHILYSLVPSIILGLFKFMVNFSMINQIFFPQLLFRNCIILMNIQEFKLKNIFLHTNCRSINCSLKTCEIYLAKPVQFLLNVALVRVRNIYSLWHTYPISKFGF